MYCRFWAPIVSLTSSKRVFACVDFLSSYLKNIVSTYFVGKKAEVGISKWLLQKNKACQVFWKTKIYFSRIRIRTCACQGVRNVSFSENLACFVFLEHPFWDSFLPYYHLFVMAAIQKELSGYKLKKVLKTKGLKNKVSSEQF